MSFSSKPSAFAPQPLANPPLVNEAYGWKLSEVKSQSASVESARNLREAGCRNRSGTPGGTRARQSAPRKYSTGSANRLFSPWKVAFCSGNADSPATNIPHVDFKPAFQQGQCGVRTRNPAADDDDSHCIGSRGRVTTAPTRQSLRCRHALADNRCPRPKQLRRCPLRIEFSLL